MTKTSTDLQASTFQKRPCYRYIRVADRLPLWEAVADIPFDQITCPVKLFNPTGIGTWWVAAYDLDGVAWGVAEIHEREVGSFYMPELVEFRGSFGLPIERDLYYAPKTIAELIK